MSLDLLNRQRGFTLIELLVAILILGVLAAVVVFAVGGVSSRGVNSVCRTDYRYLESAQEAYYSKTGSYAADADALVAAGLLREAPPDGTAAGDHFGLTTGPTGQVLVHVGAAVFTTAAGCPRV